jgi:Zn-dependent protease
LRRINTGPLTHIPQFVFWIVLEAIAWRAAFHGRNGALRVFSGVPGPETAFFVALTAGAVAMQVLLFWFNLLIPAYPLDGGRVLADFLLMRGKDEATAAKFTVFISAPIAVGMIIFGLVKFSVTIILIGAWILYSVYGVWKRIQDGTIKTHPLFNFDSEANRKQCHDEV